jgi:hypothetical protein
MPLVFPPGHQQQSDRVRILKRVITENQHAMGMIVRKYNQTVMQAVNNNTQPSSPPLTISDWAQYINDAPTNAKRLVRTRAHEAFELLRGIYTARICTDPPVDKEFTFLTLFGKYRDDQEVFLAFNNYVNAQQQQRIRPSAVLSFGKADNVEAGIEAEDFESVQQKQAAGYDANIPQEFDMRFFSGAHNNHPEQALDDDIANGYVIELDNGGRTAHVKGAARALLLTFLMDILTRKRQGAYKFKRVIMHLAGEGGVYPLENTVVQLGFRRVTAKIRGQNNAQFVPINRVYYVLDDNVNNRFAKLAAALPWNTHGNEAFTKACPLVPRTGLTYCV